MLEAKTPVSYNKYLKADGNVLSITNQPVKKTVQTGDQTRTVVWLAAMGAALIVLMILLIMKWRRREKK